jgi:hypothetical protein
MIQSIENMYSMLCGDHANSHTNMLKEADFLNIIM